MLTVWHRTDIVQTMSIVSILQRAFAPPSAAPLLDADFAVSHDDTSPAHELYALVEKKAGSGTTWTDNPRLAQYRSSIALMEERTVRALLAAAKEHDEFPLVKEIAAFIPKYEEDTRHRAAFYEFVGNGGSNFYLLEAVDRLRTVEPAFASCDFFDLDRDSKAHAKALLKVIFHFVKYKGSVSKDTSTFLKEHPEMADRVIDFIETRGIGMNSFNIEVFKLAQENAVPVLDGGVL